MNNAPVLLLEPPSFLSSSTAKKGSICQSFHAQSRQAVLEIELDHAMVAVNSSASKHTFSFQFPDLRLFVIHHDNKLQ